MLSIGLVTSAAAARSYFVGDGAACAAGYYADGSSRSGRWIGSGAGELGLAGSLDPVTGAAAFAGLLEGVAPDGTRLVAAVKRGDPRAQVPAAPLVAAVRAAAAEAGIPVMMLLDDPGLAKAWGRAVSGLTGGDRRAARGVRADVAVRIAAAGGLDPHAVYRSSSGDGTDPLAAALPFVGARVDTRRAGLDLTFSAPKSVSLLHAFADPGVAEQVEAAHAAALEQALAYLQSVAGHGLRGHQGDGQRAGQVATAGFVAAAFDHGTSRAGDPQLHTHVVVANLLQGVDGAWSAVDSRAIHKHAKTAGYLYQAVLRGELTSRLGVGWRAVTKGTAEIAGVPAKARALFSTRRTQIETALTEHGTAGPGAAQAACLATRAPKDRQTTPEQLAARWREQLAVIGVDPDDMVASALAAGSGEPLAEWSPALTAHLLGPAGLTFGATSFTRDDVLRAVCQTLPAGSPADLPLLQVVVDGVIADNLSFPLDAAMTGAEDRWTARCLLRTEQEALALAEFLLAAPHLECDQVRAAAICEYRGLSAEQSELVAAITSGQSSLSVVVGPAGAGKTAALAAAKLSWEAHGMRVDGLALSALAARQLQAGSGIPTHTVASALSTIDRVGHPFCAPGPQVMVVDEAGMVGTRDLARLLRHAYQYDGVHLVLVGDDRQLPEIEAGGLFARLAQAPTATLTENRRQCAAWEQRALARLRDGDTGAALDAYQVHDRITITASTDGLVTAVADDYLGLRAKDPAARVGVLAATRAQAAAINDAVRARLAALGRLTGPGLDVPTVDGPRELRAGDELVLTAPDRDRGLLNGQGAVVTGVDPERESVVVRVDDGRNLTLDAGWLAGGTLAHGYALTVHKGQGQTYDATLIAGSSALTAEAAYTAMSRGRTSNQLYLAPDPGRDDPAQEWLTDTALSDAGRRMATSRRHALATAMTTPPVPPQNGYRRSTPSPEPVQSAGIAMGR